MSVDSTSSWIQERPRTELEASVAAAELLLFCHDLRGSVTDVVVAATGRALAMHPGFARCQPHDGMGVGVVVETVGALLVPVVWNAGDAPLPSVRDEVERLIEAALAGRLSQDDLGAPAVVVHDPFPSAAGVLPEALGSRVLSVERPADDVPGLVLSLSVDTRDGEEATAFFSTLVRLLTHPYRRLV